MESRDSGVTWPNFSAWSTLEAEVTDGHVHATQSDKGSKASSESAAQQHRYVLGHQGISDVGGVRLTLIHACTGLKGQGQGQVREGQFSDFSNRFIYLFILHTNHSPLFPLLLVPPSSPFLPLLLRKKKLPHCTPDTNPPWPIKSHRDLVHPLY